MAEAFDKAWSLVKDSATATRSAELWAMNDYDLYFDIRNIAETSAVEGMNTEEILNELADYLPERMAHLPGFMEELLSPVDIDDTIGDSISDVDWYEVATNFEDEVRELVEMHRDDSV